MMKLEAKERLSGAGIRYCPARRNVYGRHEAVAGLPAPSRVLLSLLPAVRGISRLFAKAYGWMYEAGSCGFQVPSSFCHCRLKVPISWKPRDRLRATTTSIDETA